MSDRKTSGTSSIKNSEAFGLGVGVILLMLAAGISLVPFILSLDMMQWGYGLMCIGLFVFIAGSITLFMYLFRYLRLQEIINGEHNLAHWTYTRENMLKQAKLNLEITKEENKFKLGIVWFFFILFTVIFLIIGLANEEPGLLGFGLVMMGIAGIVSIFALVMPYVMYRNAINAAPEAIIATNGMYYQGQLHTWNRPLNFIHAIEIDEEKCMLRFKIKYFTKLGWYKYETYMVVIPIPNGEMEKAKEIVVTLTQ